MAAVGFMGCQLGLVWAVVVCGYELHDAWGGWEAVAWQQQREHQHGLSFLASTLRVSLGACVFTIL